MLIIRLQRLGSNTTDHRSSASTFTTVKNELPESGRGGGGAYPQQRGYHNGQGDDNGQHIDIRNTSNHFLLAWQESAVREHVAEKKA